MTEAQIQGADDYVLPKSLLMVSLARNIRCGNKSRIISVFVCNGTVGKCDTSRTGGELSLLWRW